MIERSKSWKSSSRSTMLGSLPKVQLRSPPLPLLSPPLPSKEKRKSPPLPSSPLLSPPLPSSPLLSPPLPSSPLLSPPLPSSSSPLLPSSYLFSYLQQPKVEMAEQSSMICMATKRLRNKNCTYKLASYKNFKMKINKKNKIQIKLY